MSTTVNELAALPPFAAYDPLYRMDRVARKICLRVLDVVSTEMFTARTHDPLNQTDAVAGMVVAEVNPSGRAVTNGGKFVAVSARAQSHALVDVEDFFTIQARNNMIEAASHYSLDEEMQMRHVATFFARGVDTFSVRDPAHPDQKLVRAFITIADKQFIRLTMNEFGELYEVEASDDLVTIDTTVHQQFIGVQLDERFDDNGFVSLSDDEAVLKLNEFLHASPERAVEMAASVAV